MKRSRINPVSAKRAAAAPDREAARAALYSRDGTRCRLLGVSVARVTVESSPHHFPSIPPCFGRPTPHHLRKQGQGGSWDLTNLLVLCSLHNEWVERERPLAWHLGLVVNRGDEPLDCWRRLRASGLGMPNDPDPTTKER